MNGVSTGELLDPYMRRDFYACSTNGSFLLYEFVMMGQDRKLPCLLVRRGRGGQPPAYFFVLVSSCDVLCVEKFRCGSSHPADSG